MTFENEEYSFKVLLDKGLEIINLNDKIKNARDLLIENLQNPPTIEILAKKSGEEKNEVRYREKKYLETNDSEQWKK